MRRRTCKEKKKEEEEKKKKNLGIRYDEWDWELVMIVADNEYAVQDWTHSVVGHWLKDLIDSYQENIILIMKSVKNGLYIKVILEVLREDGSIAFLRLKNIWASADLSININIRIFNTIVKPVLL
nr:hypothetical protein BaRGS_021171 [Batillaria attramentaria]